MEKINLTNKVNDIASNVETQALLQMSIVDWRKRLVNECQVYVYGSKYLAKRFNEINYQFCAKDTAKEILEDNLYALLRYKYFPKETDAISERINDIVKSFLTNLKTTLIQVSLNEDEECKIIKYLPNGCVAFRNGVFDFKENRWLFRYNTIRVESECKNIYLYDPTYIIFWYVNINFEAWDANIKDFTLEEFINYMKMDVEEHDNGCFKLMYNMSFNYNNVFDIQRFTHLCEILGYLCYQSFVQKFVLFVGSGQNGKNSLLDGCFTSRIVPKPASVDLGSLETDKFVTAVFENRFQNIYLETSTNEAVYKDSAVLKNITGSQDQMIEYKGKDRTPGLINCKHLWSANDADKIKFSDNTEGFRRRINIFEIWYHWDSLGEYLKKGEYYETVFSEDLRELKENLKNVECFIYFAMFGIKSATKNFSKSFDFSSNDWKQSYSDIDFQLEESVKTITTLDVVRWMNSIQNREGAKTLFFDSNRKRLVDSDFLRELNYKPGVEGTIEFFENADDTTDFFIDNYLYISLNTLKDIMGAEGSPGSFTTKFKKAFGIKQTFPLCNNRPYVKCKFKYSKLFIISD